MVYTSLQNSGYGHVDYYRGADRWLPDACPLRLQNELGYVAYDSDHHHACPGNGLPVSSLSPDAFGCGRETQGITR